MSTVRDIYDLVTYDLLEDGGLVLGLVTVQQFIDFTNLTLVDFCQKTCFLSLVETIYVQAGTSQYTYPDAMMRVDSAFLGGVFLEPATVQSLTNGFYKWRTEIGLPTRWHADELPIKTVELVTNPNDTGVYVTGPNQPDPPYEQAGWNVVLDAVTYTPAQHRDLTLIGPQMPASVSFLSDPLVFSAGSPTALFPQDMVLGYLGFGVLARIFSSDSELKDNYRAQWCQAQFEEGVAIVQAFMNEINSLQ